MSHGRGARGETNLAVRIQSRKVEIHDGEVRMSVRRRDERVEIGNAHGVLRVWQDVSALRTDTGDYLVISSQARSKGERLTMYLATNAEPVHVRVLDSRPTLLEGMVRHQLRLQPVLDDASGTHEETK